MAVYTLDTSAMMAFMNEESGYERVTALFDLAQTDADCRLLVPFIALMEVEYNLLRTRPRDEVDFRLAQLNDWPVTLLESDTRWRRAAAEVKAQGKLSLADAWVAALALINDAELVHKDPEFDVVPGLKALRLPYDRDPAGGST